MSQAASAWIRQGVPAASTRYRPLEWTLSGNAGLLPVPSRMSEALPRPCKAASVVELVPGRMLVPASRLRSTEATQPLHPLQIGRASCRESDEEQTRAFDC